MPSNSLEQEAMDRVKRMYSSFDRPRQNTPHKRPAEPPKPPRPPKPAEPEPQPVPPLEPVHKEQPHGMLELLMQDKDRSLILLLLVILMKDGADMNLLVALIYMLI